MVGDNETAAVDDGIVIKYCHQSVVTSVIRLGYELIYDFYTTMLQVNSLSS